MAERVGAVGGATSGADRDDLRIELARQRQLTVALYLLLRRAATALAPRLERGRTRRARGDRTVARPKPTSRPAGTGLLPALDDAEPAPGAAVVIRCLGHFEVLRHGQPVQHWRRSTARTLLKYLVAQRQPVSRDALLELLWPEADPATAANGFRVACHALRQALGGDAADGYLVYDGKNYCLDPRAPIWVDVYAFAAHFTAGFHLEQQHRPAEALRHYALAEALYRDDYLVDDPDAEWTQLRREELKDHYLIVLTRLADHYYQRQDFASCVACCQKILRKDPCREDAYQHLMRCHARLGQRRQALHWFEVCVEALRRDLGTTPGDETRELYLQVLRN